MFFKIRCIRLSFWRLKFLGFTRSTLSSHICSTDSIPWVHHSREEGSLDYDGRLVLLQVYLKFNMIIHHQQLACGREGDDGDVMAAQLVRPALRLLAGRAACMAASCCTCMTWRFIPPHASAVMLEPCVWAHTPVGTGLVVRGEDFPLVGNWSEMQPTGQGLDVLPVWVLTRVPSPPFPESLPWHCRSWPSHCQSCWIILLS
jgi:hypothetical protein